eukprot:1739283-Ditylum_brightwellii.AAC.1
MVVVVDDAALPCDKGITGARGVAGMVFVHKVAAALVSSRHNLDIVVQAPGASIYNDQLDGVDIVEICMGIHGELGIKQTSMMDSKDFEKIM